MNKARRTSLRKLAIQLNEINEELVNIYSDEEEYFVNIPESLKNSERAHQSEEAISILQDSSSLIEEVINNIDDVTSCWLSLL